MKTASPIVEPLEGRRLRAADLYVDSFPWVTAYDAGAALPIGGSFDITNGGDAATGGPVPYALVFRETAAGGATTDTVLKTGTTPAIAAGVARSESFSVPVPAGLMGRSGRLVAIVDPDDAIDEADEANNALVSSFPLRLARTYAGGPIEGTDGADTIRVERVIDALVIFDADGSTRMAAIADVAGLTVDLKGGDDVFETGSGLPVPMTVLGGAGDDRITGGSTAGDSFVGGDGDDAIMSLQAGAAGDDTIDGGAGDDFLVGAGGDDLITGGDGRDAINGLAGDDTILGGAGDDNLVGGDGDDRLAGDAGNDHVRGDDGDDRVAGNAGSDRIKGGDGEDTLLGQAGRDYLHGNAGRDVLIGGAGDDVLAVNLGGAGVDTLSGNGGRDVAHAPASALLASIELRHTA